MTQDIQKIIIAVLVLTATFFGYQLYLQFALPNDSNSIALEKEKVDVVDTLSEDERLALLIPGPNAPLEERKNHFELLRSLSESGGVLDITNCKSNPVVFEITHKSKFVVRNTGGIDHRLAIDPTQFFTIPAGTDIELTADFGKGPGAYGYGCDNNAGSVGVIFVTR